MQEKTEWHRVVVFDQKLADVAEKYLRKGSKVFLEGQLQTRKWTDQSGVEKYTTEVVLQVPVPSARQPAAVDYPSYESARGNPVVADACPTGG